MDIPIKFILISAEEVIDVITKKKKYFLYHKL